MAKANKTIYDNKEIDNQPNITPTVINAVDEVAEVVTAGDGETKAEVKADPKPAGFLSESDRAAMVKSIESMGASAKDLSDMELVKKLQGLAVGVNEKYIGVTADKMQAKLNGYADGAAEAGCLVKDKAFLQRLFNMCSRIRG